MVYPPVFLDRFTFNPIKRDYYLYLGRPVRYKNVEAIVQAFAAMPDRKLVVAGDGPAVAVKAVLRKLSRHDLPVAGAVLNATNLKRSVPDGLASLYRAGRAYARGSHAV